MSAVNFSVQTQHFISVKEGRAGGRRRKEGQEGQEGRQEGHMIDSHLIAYLYLLTLIKIYIDQADILPVVVATVYLSSIYLFF